MLFFCMKCRLWQYYLHYTATKPPWYLPISFLSPVILLFLYVGSTLNFTFFLFCSHSYQTLPSFLIVPLILRTFLPFSFSTSLIILNNSTIQDHREINCVSICRFSPFYKSKNAMNAFMALSTRCWKFWGWGERLLPAIRKISLRRCTI